MSAQRPKTPKDNVAAVRSPMADLMESDSGNISRTVVKNVTLSDRELRAAEHLLNVLIGEEADRGRELTRIVEKGGTRSRTYDHRLLAEHARQTFVKRALRSRYVNSSMFGEAAWDMLLALYATEPSGARHTVTGLVDLAGVPPTTALRWLNYLEQEQMATRKPDPTDKRISYVELTDKAREALDAYFAEVVAT